MNFMKNGRIPPLPRDDIADDDHKSEENYRAGDRYVHFDKIRAKSIDVIAIAELDAQGGKKDDDSGDRRKQHSAERQPLLLAR